MSHDGRGVDVHGGGAAVHRLGAGRAAATPRVDRAVPADAFVTITAPEDFQAHCQVGDLDVVSLNPAVGLGTVDALQLPRGTCAELELIPFDSMVRTVAEGPVLFVPLADPGWGQLNGQPWVSGGGFLLAPFGIELLGSIPADTPFIVVKLDAPTLQQAAADLGLESGLPDGGPPVRIDDGERAISGLMAELAAAIESDEGVLDRAALETEIAEVTARGLVGRRDTPSRRQTRVRSFAIVADADSAAAAQGWRGVTVSGLCRAIGVSETRLRRAFRDILGCSPKRFLTVRALNAARTALRDPMPDCETVSDAAADYGFWHFGRFARDYRLLFGELPSETLRTKAPTAS